MATFPQVRNPISTSIGALEETQAEVQASETSLSLGDNLKFGLFHLGSGMADVIATGIWNRIMISDLGFSATPIGLLVALRYFLAPIGVWAGRMSDEHSVLGYRRLFWIWAGRAMMAISVATLGIATASLARGNPADVLHWGAIALSLLMFSLGNALSGATFLALVYDRSSEQQRGRAVGIVWTFLLLGFTIGGIVFGVMLPSSSPENPTGGFTPETLQNLFLFGALVLGALWFFPLIGSEKRDTSPQRAVQKAVRPSGGLRTDLKIVWQDKRMRAFMGYLALSMLFAFSQDLILEPFGGEVFGMEARITTRFAAYWGSMAIVGTIVFIILARRFKAITNTIMSYVGVGVLIAAFLLFAFASFQGMAGRPLVTPGLVLLGIGLGIWNVGTLGLMTDMSPAGRAGTFLAFWTLTVTLARGVGVSGGGILRDGFIGITGMPSSALGMAFIGDGILRDSFIGITQFPSSAYGMAFIIGAVGLGIALWMLRGVNVRAFKADLAANTVSNPIPPVVSPEVVFAGGLD